MLKSVLRQYERIAAAAAAAPPTTADTEAAVNQDPHSTSTTTSRQRHQRRGTKDIVPRKARSLEKRWHQIYLRSLEWHYYLEGVIANFKVRYIFAKGPALITRTRTKEEMDCREL